MQEGIPYIGTLNHITIAMGDPILKDVASYLKTRPTATARDLIDYLVKPDDTFGTDQNNIATIVRENQKEVAGNPQQFLGIKLRDGEGSFRNIPESAQRRGNAGIVFLLESAVSEPLFEGYEAEGKPYMGLNFVVTGAESGGRHK